jgi:hypothetical protein
MSRTYRRRGALLDIASIRTRALRFAYSRYFATG